MPAPWIQRVMFRLRTLFDRRAVEREIDDELRFHLEMEASARQRAGLDAAAAKRQAARLFGGVENTKDDLRDARGGNGVETVLKDVRYALQLANKLGLGTPFGAVASEAYAQLCKLGFGQANESKIIEVARTQSSV